MKNKKRIRFGIWILCLCMVCITAYSLPVQSEEKETVRVGFCSKEGYHTVDEFGIHSGYDYEYLTEIAKYTGWEYEFVEGTWEECLAMLERGEIDLLGNVEKNSAREQNMKFSSIPSLCFFSCLLKRSGDAHLAYEDYDAFDGMTIGTVKGASINDALQKYAGENDFTYVQKEYSTAEELNTALRQGEVDCVGVSDTREISDYAVLAYFGYAELYYVTNPQRADLAEQLDSALESINAQDHNYSSKLYEKYLKTAFHIAFTKEEQAYINRKEPVSVAVYFGLGDLFGGYDSSADKYSGIGIDIMELLSERTGLEFEYTRIPENLQPREYLAEHPNVVAAPYPLNSLIRYDESLAVLKPIVEGRMMAVSRKGKAVNYGKHFVLAVPGGVYCKTLEFRKIFPGGKVISCLSHREALDLVKNGEADVALVNEMTGAYRLQSPYFSNFNITYTPDINEDITLALSGSSDPELISILNKGITSLSVRDIRQIVVNNTVADSYELSTEEWLYQNWVKLLLFAALLGTILYIFYLNVKNKKRRQEEQRERLLEEERRKADQKYREKLFRQANFDELTGLYNRTYFFEKANRLLEKNPDVVYSFLRINVRSFKIINELYGSDAGDAVLQKIGDFLRNYIGKNGIYGRLYADQFAVCTPMKEKELQAMKENCVSLLAYEGKKIRIPINVGVYVDTQHCFDAVRALDYAQIALQNGKRAGNQNFCYYEDSYLETMLRNQKIINEMENALREAQFRVYLQPQFNLNSGELVGAEALVRWFHPEEGMIPPDQFIPVFEANRFIYQLDAYMCEQVCRLLSLWIANGKAVPISVNLSRIDLKNPELVPMLQNMLRKYGVPVKYLHLEITESAFVEDQNKSERVIDELRRWGFCVEMDDFGSGYSSLNMLKDISVDILKMDMRFFGNESHMDRGGKIIEAVVRMVHALGLPVIVEGVETEREANFLRSIGCSIVQGYLCGRPVPVEEFEKCLDDNPVGEKYLELGNRDSISNLYWKMQKYDILLQNDHAILFDYDLSRDSALFTFVDETGKRHEKEILRYAEELVKNPWVHPDDRLRLKEALRGETQDTEEMDFRADYYDKGRYEAFHAVIYRYKRGREQSRTIAVIRAKQSETAAHSGIGAE